MTALTCCFASLDVVIDLQPECYKPLIEYAAKEQSNITADNKLSFPEYLSFVEFLMVGDEEYTELAVQLAAGTFDSALNKTFVELATETCPKTLTTCFDDEIQIYPTNMTDGNLALEETLFLFRFCERTIEFMIQEIDGMTPIDNTIFVETKTSDETNATVGDKVENAASHYFLDFPLLKIPTQGKNSVVYLTTSKVTSSLLIGE